MSHLLTQNMYYHNHIFSLLLLSPLLVFRYNGLYSNFDLEIRFGFLHLAEKRLLDSLDKVTQA